MTDNVIYGVDFKSKVEYERHDFAAGTVTAVTCEINHSKVLAGNALFARLSADTSPSEYTAPDGGDCA